MVSTPPGDGSLGAERSRARDRLAASRSDLAAAAREVFPPKEPLDLTAPRDDPRYPRSHLFQALTRHHKVLLVGLGLLALTQPRRAFGLATRSMTLITTVRGLSRRMGLRSD